MGSLKRSRMARLFGIGVILIVFGGRAPASASPVFSLTETPFPIGAQYSGTPPGSGFDFIILLDSLQLIDPSLTYSSVVETAVISGTQYDFNAILTGTDPVLGPLTFTGSGTAVKHSGSSLDLIRIGGRVSNLDRRSFVLPT
jgi:hypothetical protein